MNAIRLIEATSVTPARCSGAERPLVTSLGDAFVGLQLRDMSLAFAVTRDEEYVHLRMTGAGRTFDMGGRGHNYTLLTLARRRLADAAAQHADAACGWMYHDELTRGLGVSRSQLNTEIFRIRKQFAAAGLLDPEAIVERRASAGQLRIGVASLSVVTQ
jgi:hypothetical protein